MSKLMVLQKVGRSNLDSQVVTYSKLGWALLGSPYILFNNPAQAMVFTGKKAVNPGYMTLYKDGLSSIESQFSQAISAGYKPYGDGYDWGGIATQAAVSGDIEIYDIWQFSGSKSGENDGGGVIFSTTARSFFNQQLLTATQDLYYDNSSGIYDLSTNPRTMVEFSRRYISPLLKVGESDVVNIKLPAMDGPVTMHRLLVYPHSWPGEYFEDENGDGTYVNYTYEHKAFQDKELTVPIAFGDGFYTFPVNEAREVYLQITNNTGKDAEVNTSNSFPTCTQMKIEMYTPFNPSILLS